MLAPLHDRRQARTIIETFERHIAKLNTMTQQQSVHAGTTTRQARTSSFNDKLHWIDQIRHQQPAPATAVARRHRDPHLGENDGIAAWVHNYIIMH